MTSSAVIKANPASTANVTAAEAPFIRRASERQALGRVPPLRNPVAFWNWKTIPENESWNSSSLTTRLPLAGSFK